MKLIITRPVVLTGAGGMRSFVPGLTAVFCRSMPLWLIAGDVWSPQ